MKRNKWSKVLLGAALSAALIAGAQTEARAERVSSDYSDFIRGADVSMLGDIERLGGKFYDGGVQKDALQIMNQHGANYVRLRLMTVKETAMAAAAMIFK